MDLQKGIANMNIIETHNLTKKFGDFTANDHIDLQIKQGEIRAIIGENGAGKTTLMNMLYGILQPTEGEIRINGQPVNITSPKEAIELGVGMVHQHFKLSPSLTIYENVVLGVEVNKSLHVGKREITLPLIDRKEERRRVQELVDRLNYNLNIDDKVNNVSIGTKQRVEILKMLYRNVKVLILDEPTAVLIPQEIDEFMDKLQELKKLGTTIIIITHKLAEVKRCADTISVIRGGKIIDTVPNDDHATPERLSEMMVGRPVLLRVHKSGKPVGDRIVYSVKNLCAVDGSGKTLLKDISFDIYENEIVGIAGVEGNGQSELMFALTGLMKVKSGSVTLNGKNITNKWPDELRRSGLGIVPEDRYRQGLCLDAVVSDNLIAGYHMKKDYCSCSIMRRDCVEKNCEKLVDQFDIRLSGKDPKVSSLSGGNAQKVIIAREFSQEPDVMLVSQPTRGVDIGATEFIHNSFLKFHDRGKAVLIISSDLSECVGLSERVLVMHHGEIVGQFKSDEVSFQELGLYMSGAKTQKKEDAI